MHFNINFPLLTKNRRFSSVRAYAFVVSSHLYNKYIQPTDDSIVGQGHTIHSKYQQIFLLYSRTVSRSPTSSHTTVSRDNVITQKGC